jgi:hypothetical protein
MHFYQGPLLVSFISESMRGKSWSKYVCRGYPTKFNAPDKAITTRNTGQWVQHDLGALAAQERSNEFGCSVIAKSKNWVTKYGDKVGIGRFRC